VSVSVTLERPGTVAVVTGASSGIGAAIAHELASAGMALLLVGRDRARLRATCERATERGAPWCEAMAADVSEPDAARHIVEAALSADGGLDVIVPCAGVFEPQPLRAATLANFDRHMAINVRAPYALVAAAAPHLRPGGSVVLVSSICGNAGFPGAAAYCASKGAIEMLTRALARELADQDVRINAIAPGIIRTALNAAQLDGDRSYHDRLVARTPLARIGGPDEVAPAVRFLVSRDARFISGATLAIDGGWLAE
jgi:NAD(P)-dependent dehydrogenase (short-subunit alcohol dehydrogenase family)